MEDITYFQSHKRHRVTWYAVPSYGGWGLLSESWEIIRTVLCLWTGGHTLSNSIIAQGPPTSSPCPQASFCNVPLRKSNKQYWDSVPPSCRLVRREYLGWVPGTRPYFPWKRDLYKALSGDAFLLLDLVAPDEMWVDQLRSWDLNSGVLWNFKLKDKHYYFG
jgi:hypothetical protein